MGPLSLTGRRPRPAPLSPTAGQDFTLLGPLLMKPPLGASSMPPSPRNAPPCSLQRVRRHSWSLAFGRTKRSSSATPDSSKQYILVQQETLRAKARWQDDYWNSDPAHSRHSADAVQLRIRGQALQHSPTAAFLAAHPTAAAVLPAAHWHVMLQRRLGLPACSDCHPPPLPTLWTASRREG